MSYEYLYRIVILGDSCSGKTSFMNKYISNEHKITNLPTIGVDFNARIINGPENKKIKVHLWDTSGNKNFRSIARSYFGGVAGAIMLYNVGYRDTFNNLPHWLDDFRLSNRYTDIPIILLGAQFGEGREVSREEGEYYAKNNKLLYSEINFTNNTAINTYDNDILQPLWNQIWDKFIKNDEVCLGVKKTNIYREPIPTLASNVLETKPQLPFITRIKNELNNHIADLKSDGCIIC